MIKIITKSILLLLITSSQILGDEADPRVFERNQTLVKSDNNVLTKILFWLPNRALDFLDIFHIDLGLGPSVGGVVRMTRYAQVGYRKMDPASFRIGIFDRRAPYTIETTDEKGIGPNFQQSFDRKICNGEFGLGLDLLIFGGYGGLCLDEAVDFLGGLFFLDIMKDDYHAN